MKDFEWIEEVSNGKIEVLKHLLVMKIPSNMSNAYHKRMDLLKEYLTKSKKYSRINCK